MDGIQYLGLRIVEAARLAVAVHLYESVARHTEDPSGDVSRAAKEILRQRRDVETGGAGPSEDATTLSRLGDLVTDDEWDGLMGRDADEDVAGGGGSDR